MGKPFRLVIRCFIDRRRQAVESPIPMVSRTQGPTSTFDLCQIFDRDFWANTLLS